ncbi:MAG: response regulator [Deltaproteobacteria bacterium]|jgi:two-component system, chemotaxis family, chemotaxis protein CheY|nr:response regulator [Deltaproteobacteria bacterium]MBT4264019.1 response regulator [Deltaproteobacteria bacterium]MBT4640619.1 response regulator [Deltaproteobacteria bacterium]MBT6505046.1 response regulator [Deltaproteobacteria bacterium]MBT7155566.1 response regulator [Deltaproteobacteria bacterium]
MRFLVVDDELTNRKLLTTMLEDAGYCDVAVNGQEAVECFRMTLDGEQAYDVIFLDIKMPVMDGHEALKQIRALEEKKGIFVGDGVKIVMVTALGDKKNILEAFHEGCEYYLVKPFQQKKILELLNEMDLLKLEE